jgi:hypothetical protein
MTLCEHGSGGGKSPAFLAAPRHGGRASCIVASWVVEGVTFNSHNRCAARWIHWVRMSHRVVFGGFDLFLFVCLFVWSGTKKLRRDGMTGPVTNRPHMNKTSFGSYSI